MSARDFDSAARELLEYTAELTRGHCYEFCSFSTCSCLKENEEWVLLLVAELRALARLEALGL